MTEEACRGFWSMCGCSVCRARDVELQAELKALTPEQRRARINDLIGVIERDK